MLILIKTLGLFDINRTLWYLSTLFFFFSVIYFLYNKGIDLNYDITVKLF